MSEMYKAFLEYVEASNQHAAVLKEQIRHRDEQLDELTLKFYAVKELMRRLLNDELSEETKDVLREKFCS